MRRGSRLILTACSAALAFATLGAGILHGPAAGSAEPATDGADAVAAAHHVALPRDGDRSRHWRIHSWRDEGRVSAPAVPQPAATLPHVPSGPSTPASTQPQPSATAPASTGLAVPAPLVPPSSANTDPANTTSPLPPTGSTGSAIGKVLWGIGDEVDAATKSEVYRTGTAQMVTAWYNGPGDLSWMRGYSQPSTLSDLYGSGKSVELVVWLGDHPDYAISDQFQQDISALVTAMKGSGPHYGPLYVVLFSEWETYSSDPAYTAALKSAYLRAVERVHAAYAQAKVALGFGGYAWSGTPDRDLSFWNDAVDASDFTAVQAMQACDSVKNGRNIIEPQIRSSVQQLGSYGKPVMISHFKLWGAADCQASAFRQLAADMFTDSTMAELTSEHLFAWDFMQDHYITDTVPADSTVSTLLRRYAAAS